MKVKARRKGFIPMNKKNVKLYWDTEESDWLVVYPDSEGKALSKVLLDMIRTEKRWLGQTLVRLLTDKGYDFSTFEITVNKIYQP